jgi:molybdopterin molybdotransferase
MRQASLSISAAREAVLAVVRPVSAEPVPVGIAAGRVLAQEIRAAHDAPPFDNSAMDGFAVAAASSSGPLRIAGEARAGQPAAMALRPGEAIRISTGAPLPAGADAVVPLEQAQLDGDHVTATAPAAPGRYVRRAGEDLRGGQVVLRAGARLGPGELAVAIAAGAGELSCARRPRVAIVCTGDELRAPGAALAPGEIHDANAAMLAVLAAQAGGAPAADPRATGGPTGASSEPAADRAAAGGGDPWAAAVRVVADDRASTEAALAAAVAHADVVIVSGGVSVGPHDHVKAALAALGAEQRFWGLDLRPGHPTWFGTRGERLVFGLPGNPVSSFVTFTLFARPALLALQGASAPLPAREQAVLAEQVRRGPREQALRVRLAPGDDGVPRATPTGPQGSHVTASLTGAGALAFVAPGDGVVAAGERVAIERL